MKIPTEEYDYTVRWEIDLNAVSPREACEQAAEMMRAITHNDGQYKGACCFTAIEHPNDVRTFIDLENDEEED